MKKYQRCEVEILVLQPQDVVKTSTQTQTTDVSLDYFNDTWWTIGGNV
ncbi:MAG: hypothetical protein IJW60_03295 [Clostridia bacterium]|nr:hypothetical protein [Clostridia bacterium]